MKRFVSLFLALVMVLTTMTIGVSAASDDIPTITSHDDGEMIEVSSKEKLVIKYKSVKGASHYYARVKVLKGAPSPGNNERSLSSSYDFEYDGIWGTKLNVFGYDLEGAEGNYIKVYVEARTAADRFISNSSIYLFLRKPAEDFTSPWEYGLLPMKTTKKTTKMGASGDSIKALKQAINIVLGEDRVKITAGFDSATQKALQDAQRYLGIDDDGIFGPESLNAFLKYLEKNGHGMPESTYDPEAALEYALKYNGKHPGTEYNPQFPSFPGNNCANFVSQCLVAGGLAVSSVWNPTKSSWKTCRYSPSNRTDGLMTYLEELGYTVYGYDSFTKNGASISKPLDINKIKPGDIIFSKGSSDTISGHVMIVDHVNSDTGYIFYHGSTNDRCGCTSCQNKIHFSSVQSHVAMSEKSK